MPRNQTATDAATITVAKVWDDRGASHPKVTLEGTDKTRYSTFDVALFDKALGLEGQTVRVEYYMSGQYRNFTAVSVGGEATPAKPPTNGNRPAFQGDAGQARNASIEAQVSAKESTPFVLNTLDLDEDGFSQAMNRWQAAFKMIQTEIARAGDQL